ncbi:SRPBCC family protein [Streptomyces sp. SID14478]|uniref:SRPBCC family protein n=1 Tax=Streptomyces sp. SID14478 TaxID=2706073 RepID=UPI0013DA3756|nr:SRPBCC family protein [Streptomyces sp. SID14478]NEB79117.1 SRPBCC family protein [Streptomyces sp. SID14478]
MADAKNPLGAIATGPAVDRLKAEAQAYLMAQVMRLVSGAGQKLDGATGKLTDMAEGQGPGLMKMALSGGKKLAEGKGPLRTAMEVGAGGIKDKVTGMFKGLGGKRKKGGAGQKPTVILEYVDVGVPLRQAYDQWTQYQEFSQFATGVKGATVADDTTSDWKLKVFWSNRSWKAHTTEQVPDQRITWTSEGAKGSTKGVVTFHELGENLTRIVLVIEYYPKGLFEKTGNIWRAQGRRTRLDLKHYARHITIKGEAEDGWRGEIRDGEVVVSHEDALEQEEQEREELEAAEGGDGDEDLDAEESKSQQDEYEAEFDDEADADAEERNAAHDEEQGGSEHAQDEREPEGENEDGHALAGDGRRR